MTGSRFAAKHLPVRVAHCPDELPLHDVRASRAIESFLSARKGRSLPVPAPRGGAGKLGAARRFLESGPEPDGSLMACAGRAVAHWVLALQPDARRVWVAAGPGGNGGDGLHAAAHLAQAGLDVSLSWIARPSDPGPDVLQGLQRARLAGVSFVDSRPAISQGDLALDALLGLGGHRPPQGPVAQAIRTLNEGPGPCLSVDLPSGLNGDTGACLGDEAVHAQATLSLLTLKPGLFIGGGRDHAGEIWFDPLVPGTQAPVQATGRLSSRQTWQAALPERLHVHHKGSFGDVVVVGGDRGMAGALRLAGEAALRAGAGRILLSPLDHDQPLQDAVRPEWLWRARAWAATDGSLERGTLVCGCGGGAAVGAALPALLSRAGRLVLDADALNAIAADEGLASQLRTRSARGGITVLTPHPLEAARLLRTTVVQVQADRIGAARELVAQTGCVVVLKGSGTLIASANEAMAINPTGHAGLGSGGTGDVLAGWIGGLWSALSSGATDTSPRAQERMAHQAAAASVWLHGHASESWAGRPVVASELARAMAEQVSPGCAGR